MLLATILLLSPISQVGSAAKIATDSPAVHSSELTNDSSFSQPLPSAPEPKVDTDATDAGSSAAEPVEAVQPHYAPMSLAAVKPARNERYEPSARQRKVWYALTVTGSGAATFDAWSTRRAISQGYATEANPLLRPFSHSGAMYAATQVSPLVMDFIGKRMMVSQHKWIRRMWWLPQTAGSGFSIAAGVHNVGIVP
jgi:hypothetical protein